MSILLSTINQEWPSFLRCRLRRYAQYGNHARLFLETETAIPRHASRKPKPDNNLSATKDNTMLKEDLTKAIGEIITA